MADVVRGEIEMTSISIDREVAIEQNKDLIKRIIGPNNSMSITTRCANGCVELTKLRADYETLQKYAADLRKRLEALK